MVSKNVIALGCLAWMNWFLSTPAIASDEAAEADEVEESAAAEGEDGSAEDESAEGASAAQVAAPAASAGALADPAAVDPAVVAPESAAPIASAPKASLPNTGGVAADGSVFDFLGDGMRHEMPDRGFAIKPPRGWEVYANHPNLSLLMQVPWQKDQKYQRTIQVASFSGPRYMDEMTAHEYETLIVRKFSETTAEIENYRVRNHMTIELVDGREAILFYTEFSIRGVDLMQAHVLASASDRHFLTTYTDLAAHFEGELSERYLAEAWESMISLELSSPTPFRYQPFVRIGYAIGALVLLGLLVVIVRWVQAKRASRFYAQGRMPGRDDETTHMDATTTGVSQVGDDEGTQYSQAVSHATAMTSLTDEPLTGSSIRSLTIENRKDKRSKNAAADESFHTSQVPIAKVRAKAQAEPVESTVFPSAFALSRISDEDDEKVA